MSLKLWPPDQGFCKLRLVLSMYTDGCVVLIFQY
eukprot:SAG31_NODE_29200_length_399_cov_0.863333_1_plen_33_part_01